MLYTEIRSLKGQLADTKETISFERTRYGRITYLLNQRTPKGSNLSIEKTSKGFNVLTSVNTTEKEFEVEVFDLDHTRPNLNRRLVLWADFRVDHFYIHDIQGGTGNGHGSIALAHLMEHVKKWNLAHSQLSPLFISGKLHTEGKENQERQDTFYQKFGFLVDKEEMKISYHF